MTDTLNLPPAVKVAPLCVKQEVFLIMIEHVPGLGNLLLLGVLADLGIVEVRGLEPVPDLDVVKVRGNKHAGVVHRVLLESWHHLLSEIFEPGLNASSEAVGGQPVPHETGVAQDGGHGPHLGVRDHPHLAHVVGALPPQCVDFRTRNSTKDHL